MAKTEVITNQYDGPRPPDRRILDSPISLDYANSNDAAVIDTGIRETIKGVHLSILAMGLGLARLKAKGLYVDLYNGEGKPYHSMNDYLEGLCDDMRIERSTAHNWLYIGEVWLKYRKELEKIEFSDTDGLTKLPYVERALETHDRKEVFRNVKLMGWREFKKYSVGEAAAQPPSKITVKGNQVFIGKKLAVTLAEELDPKTRAHLERINVQAGEALEAGEVLYTTRLYDLNELRGFSQAAERLKKQLRIGRDKTKKK